MCEDRSNANTTARYMTYVMYVERYVSGRLHYLTMSSLSAATVSSRLRPLLMNTSAAAVFDSDDEAELWPRTTPARKPMHALRVQLFFKTEA